VHNVSLVVVTYCAHDIGKGPGGKTYIGRLRRDDAF